MSERYDTVAGSFESPFDFGHGEFKSFTLTPGMLLAIEIRQLQIADPLLAFTLIANRNAGRVLELLKMVPQGVA